MRFSVPATYYANCFVETHLRHTDTWKMHLSIYECLYCGKCLISRVCSTQHCADLVVFTEMYSYELPAMLNKSLI